MRSSRWPRFATRTASTLGLGTRGFFGSIRSFHTQANPLSLSLTRTEKAKSPAASSVSGKPRAMRRTSACVAMMNGAAGRLQRSLVVDHERDVTRDSVTVMTRTTEPVLLRIDVAVPALGITDARAAQLTVLVVPRAFSDAKILGAFR